MARLNDRYLEEATGISTEYLNTVEEGGETEFLYQSMRVKPEQGTLLIHPGGFTHTHRGNPPLKGVKYFMNTWIISVE